MRLTAIVLLACTTIACGTASEQRYVGPRALHPVIILDIDTLRADHLGAYGYGRPTSPNIDALASDSVLFDWAFSQAPNTPPSQASILTSLYPTSHGLISETDHLSPVAATLAESFRAAGAATSAFVDGGYMSARFGLDRGFETYDDNRGGGLGRIGPKVLDWLRQHRDQSFLLLVHTYDVHTPYSPKEPHRSLFTNGLSPSPGFDPTPEQMEAIRASQWTDTPRKLSSEDLAYAIARYDGGIRFVDDWVGQLVATLRQLDLYERSTIVLLSDHGEEFQEHGNLLHEKLYATVNHVPLLIRPSGFSGPGRRASAHVATIDVMPTLLELNGLPAAKAAHGQSLLPLIEGTSNFRPRPVFSESPFFSEERAVVKGDFRLIWRRETGARELYRYRQDADEQVDLASDEPRSAADLLETVRRWDDWLQTRRLPRAPASAADAENEQQLRGLGYVK